MWVVRRKPITAQGEEESPQQLRGSRRRASGGHSSTRPVKGFHVHQAGTRTDALAEAYRSTSWSLLLDRFSGLRARRTSVDGHERTFVPATELVNLPGDEFLAGAQFALVATLVEPCGLRWICRPIIWALAGGDGQLAQPDRAVLVGFCDKRLC